MKNDNSHKNFFLLKLLSVNSLGVVANAVFGFVSQKLIAIYLGASGIAYVGNFRNIISLIAMGSSLGIDQGIVKSQAQYNDNKEQLKKLYATSNAYAIIGCLLTTLVLLFNATMLSTYLFKTDAYYYIIIILAISTPFFAIYKIGFSILNGNSNYRKATLLTISVTLSVTILIVGLVKYYALPGVLLAISLTPLLQFIVLYVLMKKTVKVIIGSGIKFYKEFGREFILFTIMALVAVVLNNFVELEIRNQLFKKLSIADAGYWTSVTKISNYYLAFIVGLYSLYVLPKFSRINNLKDFHFEIKHFYKNVLPFFGVLLLGIYFLRVIVIEVLYTKEFVPMENLFKWQLIGDFIKVMAMTIAYLFIAKRLWKTFIVTEFLSLLLFYCLSLHYLKSMGGEGVVFAHFLRYVIYLVVVICCVVYFFKRQIKDEVIE